MKPELVWFIHRMNNRLNVIEKTRKNGDPFAKLPQGLSLGSAFGAMEKEMEFLKQSLNSIVAESAVEEDAEVQINRLASLSALAAIAANRIRIQKEYRLERIHQKEQESNGSLNDR